MAKAVTFKGSDDHPDIGIKMNEGNTLTEMQIHMDHAEVGPWIPCLKLAPSVRRSMTPSAAYAAHLLFHAASDTNELAVNQADFERLTLVVERELRRADVQLMRGTGFQSRVNVHLHFLKPEEKGFTTSKILMKDLSGSSILIKGPYAPTIEAAIFALEHDLVMKLRDAVSRHLQSQSTEWIATPFTKAVGGAEGDEPRLPCTTWTAVNVIFMSADHANCEGTGDRIACKGEYIQRM